MLQMVPLLNLLPRSAAQRAWPDLLLAQAVRE